MTWIHVYLGGAAGALALSALLTGVFRRLGAKWDLFDRPDSEAHKGHAASVPLLGGVAMFAAWLAVLGAGLVVVLLDGGILGETVGGHLAGVGRVVPELVGIACGAGLLVVLGAVDDHCHLSAGTKFAGQIAAAVLVVALGVRATFFAEVPWVPWLGSLLWIVFVINAMNFLDNMDGLAAGVGTVAAVFFAVVAGLREQFFVATLASVAAGVAAGFLLHNRPPASIFMGDAGSHFLGFLLACLGVLTTYYEPSQTPTPAAVLIPFFILAVPILDLVVVVAARLRNGKPVYVGDHTHISHRFEQMGFTRAQSVLLVYALVFATGASGVFLVWLPPAGVLLALLQTAAVVAAVGILQYARRSPPPA